MKNLLSILLIMCMPVYAQTSGTVIHNIMRTHIAPNAIVLFNFQTRTTITEFDWKQLNESASSLHDAAHILKKINTNPEWQQQVNAIDRLSEISLEQVQERNIKGLTNTGNLMYNVCMNCHVQFFPKGKNL